jgi:hypothetical protein
MNKTVLFAFNGEPATFAHVLLNAMEMKRQGWDAKVVVESEAVKLVSLLRNPAKPFGDVYREAMLSRVIDGVCKTCANRHGVTPAVTEQNLKLLGEMSGHPSIARYRQEGYEVLVF